MTGSLKRQLSAVAVLLALVSTMAFVQPAAADAGPCEPPLLNCVVDEVRAALDCYGGPNDGKAVVQRTRDTYVCDNLPA